MASRGIRLAIPVLLGTLLTAPCSQIAVRAVTRTGLQVSAGPAQNVPPNTDITAGASITSNGSFSYGSAAATTDFALSRTERSIEVTLRENASAFWNGQGGIFFPSAWIGLFPAIPPEHTIDLELSSATPTTVRLVIETCSFSVGGPYSGTLSIPGHGVVTNNSIQFIMCSSPASRTIDLALGPTPTVLVFRTSGNVQSSRIYSSVSLEAGWRLSIAPLPPCEGTAYETPCGATLSSYGTLSLPGSWFELVDATRRPTAALLLVGTQHLRVPIDSCFLYTDFPVLLPFSLTAPDRAQVYLPPMPFAGQVTMQGFTFGTGWLHGSNGLDVSCR